MEVWLTTGIALLALLIGDGVVTEIIMKKVNKSSSTTKVLKALSYHQLAREIERLIAKGYATSEERKELSVLFEAYNSCKWNGDMDERMKKVYVLPLTKKEV